jgi:lipoprotein-anchoring transpeptidase ErfK/SrfK
MRSSHPAATICGMHQIRLLSTGAALALTFLTGAACGKPDHGQPTPAHAASRSPADAGGSEIATARGSKVTIFHRQGDTSAWRSMPSPNGYGAPRVFLVDQDASDWLRVRLPIRPNGSTGWIKTPEVSLTRTTRRVEIDPAAFRFTVLDGRQVLRTGKVATGEGGTPTPAGLFFFTELLRPQDPEGPYGAYAFGLSGFSSTLKSFAGGPGQIAVHGTNAPGLLGSKASHGCIRVSNADITWMAQNLPLGTPVEIKT